MLVAERVALVVTLISHLKQDIDGGMKVSEILKELALIASGTTTTSTLYPTTNGSVH